MSRPESGAQRNLPAAEEVRAIAASSYSEIPSEKPYTAREELIRLRDTTLQAANKDSPVIDRVQSQDRDLSAPEAVKVHEVEQEAIPNVRPRDGAEETCDLVFREVLHGTLSRSAHPELIPSRKRDLAAFPHFRKFSYEPSHSAPPPPGRKAVGPGVSCHCSRPRGNPLRLR